MTRALAAAVRNIRNVADNNAINAIDVLIMKKTFLRFISHHATLYVLSAFLLSLSFPKSDFSFLAWIALVPLMLSLDDKKSRTSFLLAYFCGIIFFFLTLYWFVFVTALGAGLLFIYFSVYFGLFGLGYFWISRRGFFARFFLVPSLWVTLEYARAHLFSGFGWVSLGYSQYQNLSLIQIADITGVYGVSFLIVMVNVLCKETFLFFKGVSCGASRKELAGGVVIAVVLIGLGMGYGLFRFSQHATLDEHKKAGIKVGVAQGNVPHERRWSQKAWPFILRDYISLSQALTREKVDLVVWPESAYPGYAGEDPKVADAFKVFLAKTKTPHLIGMITKKDDQYFNSAVLFTSASRPGVAYHKMHLVPFGEFIPLRKEFPFLADIVPIDDFKRGEDHVLFEAPTLGNTPKKFFYSVLICFEDTVPELVRAFVKNGAHLLINISNDAWFEDTREPFLHLQSAVFRSIENRRFLVRCGNVGVSGFIDPYGRIQKVVQNAFGKTTYVEGVAAQDVFFFSEKTLYTKFGDFFAYFCISGILIGVARSVMEKRAQRRSL